MEINVEKNHQINLLNSIITTQDLQIENCKRIGVYRESQFKLVSTERDSYKILNKGLRSNLEETNKLLQKEQNRKKNFRNFSIGSTTVAVGAIVFLLLK